MVIHPYSKHISYLQCFYEEINVIFLHMCATAFCITAYSHLICFRTPQSFQIYSYFMYIYKLAEYFLFFFYHFSAPINIYPHAAHTLYHPAHKLMSLCSTSRLPKYKNYYNLAFQYCPIKNKEHKYNFFGCLSASD